VTFLTLRRTPDMLAGRCGYEVAGVCETAKKVLLGVGEDDLPCRGVPSKEK
jgi:hypothetical protein